MHNVAAWKKALIEYSISPEIMGVSSLTYHGYGENPDPQY